MKRKEINTLLIESLQLQQDLVELCTECMKDIFGDDYGYIDEDFENSIKYFGDGDCLRSLAAYKEMVEMRKAYRKTHLEGSE